jgi:hypothetical protein
MLVDQKKIKNELTGGRLRKDVVFYLHKRGGVNKMCVFVSILLKFNSTCLLTQLTAKVSARLAGNFLHLLYSFFQLICFILIL